MSETAMTGEIEALVARLRGIAVCEPSPEPADTMREAAEALTRLNRECAAERERREAAEQLAYDLRYAAAGGEDVPGSANAVTVADVDRWRKEAEARALTAEAALAKAVGDEREACAVIADTAADCLMGSTFGGVARAIRARANGESP